MTEWQRNRVRPMERFLATVLGPPRRTVERQGKYPNLRLEWADRGRIDLYPQIESVALGTTALDVTGWPPGGIRGVAVTQGGQRLRVDDDHDADGLRDALRTAWRPTVHAE